LLISPRVGQIGWFDFHRADDLIAHGARAAERAIESIQEAIDILAPGAARQTSAAVRQTKAAGEPGAAVEKKA
jgi:NTE family protein